MRIVKVGVLAPTNKGIPLGVQGENRATKVEFDTRPWFREYPSGTVSAVARRYGDPAPYPLTLDVDDGTAVWNVSDTDTAKAGEGAVELTMTSAGARVRSLTFKTLVTASLTDSPVDDDAWYGWLDKAVVKVDETVQSAQRKMDEVDLEWTALKADVTAKVNECGDAAKQAAQDAHHAKVDAQATAKALESAEGSVAKSEAAADRAVDAALASDDSAVEASRSALSAGDSAEAARLSADAAANSAGDAATSASNAADAASAASGSASAAEQSATDASNAKAAAQTAKAGAETAASNAATSASNAESSATAAAKSASDAAASVGAINVIAPKKVTTAANAKVSNIAVGNNANAINGYGSVAIGFNATAYSESVSIGDGATSGSESRGDAVAIGHGSAAEFTNSVSLGSLSVCSKANEVSFGKPPSETVSEYTREITHVSAPTGPTSAATKKYTDDNYTKTLSEAKKYTDDNTSNALVGTVSGKLLHVEDAWPCKPLGLTIDGAYKQDGTPSPEAPVPITVVEHMILTTSGKNIIRDGMFVDGNIYPVFIDDSSFTLSFINDDIWWTGNAENEVYVHDYYTNDYVAFFNINPKEVGVRASGTFDGKGHNVVKIISYGRFKNKISDMQIERGAVATAYAPYVGTSLPINLPAEHPYLASLPDGTHDEIAIDKDGNASLVARVQKVDVSNLPAPTITAVLDSGLTRYEYRGFINPKAKQDSAAFAPSFSSVIDYRFKTQGMYASETYIVVGATADPTETLKTGGYIYTTLATPITYNLGKLDIPSLPETISNVWTDAELTTNMSMTYKRDINVAFDNLVQAVVAAAAGE